MWNADKTGPLVNDEAAQANGKAGHKQDDDDQVDRMRKQAASGLQRPDDRPADYDPPRQWDGKQNEVDEQTGDIKLFRVGAVDQAIQGRPTDGTQPGEQGEEQEKEHANQRGRPGV